MCSFRATCSTRQLHVLVREISCNHTISWQVHESADCVSSKIQTNTARIRRRLNALVRPAYQVNYSLRMHEHEFSACFGSYHSKQAVLGPAYRTTTGVSRLTFCGFSRTIVSEKNPTSECLFATPSENGEIGDRIHRRSIVPYLSCAD